jgi:RHS repeat-associated protein
MGTFPFGESWYNASNDKLLFTSYERDSESGNDYAQARYNISRLARFSSPDPLPGSTSDPQSLNRYSYVRNMPVMLTDPTGLVANCNTAQNRDPSQQQDSEVGGPFDPGESAGFDPAQTGCGGRQAPCGFTLAGCGDGGLGGLDGGYSADDSGIGGSFTLGTGDPFSLINAAFTPTAWRCDWWPDCGDDNWYPIYGNLGLLGLLGGPGSDWKDNPNDLILQITKDCFNKAQGQREIDYKLVTSSGATVKGNYNITEQLSDTSLAPPWGQSSNHPELGVDEINQFHDAIRPALYSSGSSRGVQYFLVSPAGLGDAQWVPISPPGQATIKFNTIEMQGAPNPASNIIKVNGKIAPPC